MKITTQLENIPTCGLSVELTTSQTQNGLIIQAHWIKFNAEIKRLKRNKNSGNWVKYGFTYKVNEKYFYLAAIPFLGNEVPNDFETMLIPKGEYVFFEHLGNMNAIKSTIYSIYKVQLPQLGIKIENQSKEGFIHFEKYDSRFKWNNPNSILEIHLPISIVSE